MYPSQNTGTERTGTVVISANGVSFNISITQEGVYVQPQVYSITAITGVTISNTSWSFDVPNQRLTVVFTPGDLIPSPKTLYVAVYRDNVEKDENSLSGRNGVESSTMLDLGETPPSGSFYYVYIDDAPITIKQ